MNPADEIAIQRWPPERFYWAVLDVPGWKPTGGGTALPPGLAAEAAEELPLDMTELHTVVASIGGGRVLLCSAMRESLAQLDPLLLRLVPERLPPCAADFGVDSESLNLLVGEFEPVMLRRERGRRHLLAIAATLVASAFITIGMLRRAEHWHRVELRAHAAATAIVERVPLPPGEVDADPATALLAESIRLQRLAEGATALRLPTDVTPALSKLLAAWPTSVPSKPQSLSLGPTSASISVLLEEEPAAFLNSFMPPRGWAMDEPRLNRAGSVTRVNLLLRPAPSAPATQADAPRGAP